ncbi:hypothetical protein [Aeromicrobium sp. UC242_57]|uniref:hypothetical protein n=1 Tax=Aeromicrobium sp. UC242_57 TaxID=3374624 RepID=UPI0037AA90B9
MNLTELTTSILASVVIAAGLVTTSTLPAEAAAKNTVRANPAKPIVNERFTVTGKLSTPVKRKAYLQLKSAGKWKKVDTDTTTSKGAYKLSSRTKADRDYRIVAPATTIHGKSYKRINGPAKKVRVVEQTAKIKTSNATPSVGESITITGTFSPRARDARWSCTSRSTARPSSSPSGLRTVRAEPSATRSSRRATRTLQPSSSCVRRPARVQQP